MTASCLSVFQVGKLAMHFLKAEHRESKRLHLKENIVYSRDDDIMDSIGVKLRPESALMCQKLVFLGDRDAEIIEQGQCSCHYFAETGLPCRHLFRWAANEPQRMEALAVDPFWTEI